MSRAIVYATARGRARSAGAPARVEPDGYADKLMKLIPVESVTLYLTMVSGVRGGNLPEVVLWFVFAFVLVATYFYLRVVLKIEAPRQLFVTLGAFCVWAFTIGGPFEQVPYSDSIGAMILPAYTFMVPIFLQQR